MSTDMTVGATEQIPRSSVVWLLIAQFAVMLPHSPRLSWWMIVIWLLCALWRLAMFRGEARYPGVLIRLVMVVVGCIGIAVDFGRLGGLDITVALLILAFSLKMIEVRQRRDLFLVLYLAYFVVAAAFLFSQSILLAFYQIACVILITTALAATQQAQSNLSQWAALRTATKLILQAIPIMLVFFVVFPRLGPLWSVPTTQNSSQMGIGDTMSPGDIAELSRSGGLAFRVVFDNTIPSREQLYWRGTTLSYFDGRSWGPHPALPGMSYRQLNWSSQPLTSSLPVKRDAEVLRYELTLEASENHWVFALPAVSRFNEIDYSGKRNQITVTNDLSLRSSMPLYTRISFQIESQLGYTLEHELPKDRRFLETAIPSSVNPKSQALARRWLAEADSPSAYVNRVLSYFREEPFFYTLHPPLLGKHSVDEFIFESRRGFCEHYAGAFAFLMRAANIPARIVVGYQGGEENPFNNSITVRQFDAHAWTEVWLAGQGWQRVDPTSAVAPQRILEGLEQALSNREEFLSGSAFSPLRYRDIAWLSAFRLRLDAINYQWQKWVVNFDTARQMSVLKGLIGKITPLRVALFMLSAMGIILALVAVSVLRHRVSPNQRVEDRLYWQFCQRLERQGLVRAAGEAPGDFAQRIATQQPELAHAVNKITQCYQAIVYADINDPLLLKELKRLVRNFKPQLAPVPASKLAAVQAE